MFKHYHKTSLLLLVAIAAVLSVVLYLVGASFLVKPIQIGDVVLGKSIAALAKDSLFAPLKPLMYALIIMSIGSALAISRGGLGAKFARVFSFFIMFSVLGAVVAVIGFNLFSHLNIFVPPETLSSNSQVSINRIPLALKLYGVLTSPLMISIFAGVVFGNALKKLDLGTQADAISDLFMKGFRKFLQITIPLAVFGSVTLALNSEGGVGTLGRLLPLVGVYLVTLGTVWVVMVSVTCFILKKPPSFVLRATFPQAVVALSSSSSIATLPATKIACDQLGANGDESSPFFTIGATINMAGTLMGLTLLSLYAMKGYGLDISFTDQVVVALQSMIYAISAAGVPSASVVLVQDILTSQGVSAEYASYVTGLIITMDTLILDRLRTTLNTQSDSMSTANGLHLYYKTPRILED